MDKHLKYSFKNKAQLLVIAIFFTLSVSAQQSAGIFGKRNTIGINTSINLLNFSRYSKGSIIIPTIQYTRSRNRKRSYVFEYGRFNVRVRGNNGYDRNDNYLHAGENVYGRYYIVTSTGTGKAVGNQLSLYSVRSWENMGQLGGYHSWGVHIASLQYKSDQFTYQYEDRNGVMQNTSYPSSKRPIMAALAFSFSMGKKGMIGKSDKLVWDYGFRLRAPLIGIDKPYEAIYDGREYLVYHATRAYAFNTIFTIYAGLHCAF